MGNQNTNETKNLPKQIIGVIIVGVTLILGVVIFTYLADIGLPSTGNEISETVVFNSNIERLNVPLSTICDITSITDLNGTEIDPSEYTINNCEVIYTP